MRLEKSISHSDPKLKFFLSSNPKDRIPEMKNGEMGGKEKKREKIGGRKQKINK